MVTLIYEAGAKQEWVGLSTDTKPTVGVSNGATFTELDGGATFKFNGDVNAWLSTTATKFVRSISVNLTGIGTQYENLAPDLEGMVVTATYSDNTTATVTGYTVDAPSVWAASGNKITVLYVEAGTGARKTENVSVTAQALASIAVGTAPTKVEYEVGEFFDPTGLVITATYNNALTEDFAYPCEDMSFNPDTETALTAEDESVTITLTLDEVSKTATQAITVTE